MDADPNFLMNKCTNNCGVVSNTEMSANTVRLAAQHTAVSLIAYVYTLCSTLGVITGGGIMVQEELNISKAQSQFRNYDDEESWGGGV